LVAKVSVWDLYGTTRQVLYVIMCIIADILCSIAYLDAHTADLNG